MSLRTYVFMAVLATSGCATFQPMADMDGRIPTSEARVTPTEVAALRPGAVVHLDFQSPDVLQTFKGTVLQASPHGVALINCERSVRSDQSNPITRKIPYVNRLTKSTAVGRSRVPVQWVSIHEITDASEITPPPPDYVAPQLEINTNDEPIFERLGIDFDFNLAH